MQRLDRYARSIGLELTVVTKSRRELQRDGRMYDIRVQGRTTMRVTAYVRDAQSNWLPDAEVVLGDASVERFLARVLAS